MNRALQLIREHSFYETLYHSKNYFISNIAIKALGFVSLPVMTRILLPQDYGILSVFNSYQTLFVSIFTMNCYVALSRYYFEQQDDFREFFGTLIVFVTLLLSLLSIIFIKRQDYISEMLGVPGNAVLFIVPFVFFYVWNSWYEQIYVPQRQSSRIMRRNIISSYGAFGLSVFMIMMLREDKYLGQIYASSIIGVLFSLYYLFALKQYIRLSLRIRAIKYFLSYSLPLLPYSLSGVILNQFDRILVNKYAGSADAGLYSFAYTIGMLLTLVVSALQQAWVPSYYAYMDHKNFEKLNSDIAKILSIVMIAALFLIYFGKDIGILLAKPIYHASLVIIPAIVMSYVFYSVFTFYAWHMQYVKKNIYLSMCVLVAGCANVLLNYTFIPKYGYVAAAYVSCASYFIMVSTSYLISRLILGVDFPSLRTVSRYMLMILPFVLFYYMTLHLHLSLAADILLKVIMLGVFTILIILHGMGSESVGWKLRWP